MLKIFSIPIKGVSFCTPLKTLNLIGTCTMSNGEKKISHFLGSHNLSGQINLQLPNKWQYYFLYILLTTTHIHPKQKQR